MIPGRLYPQHPPGPANWNGPTGLTWRHAYQLVFHPLPFLGNLTARYGDISFFRLFGRRGYFLNHPDLIAQVLISEADAFEKLPRQMNVIRQIFGKGILVTDGNRWKADRQFLQKAFGRQLMVRNRASSIDAANNLIEKWYTRQPANQPIDLVWEMTRLTAELTSKVLVQDADPQTVDTLTEAIIFLSDEMSHEMNSVACLPDWLPLSRKRRKRRTIQAYHRFFDSMIARRRQRGSSSDDFLGFLLSNAPPSGVDNHFIRDQFLTILLAGYHATSMSLVWFFHAVEQNPQVENRILAELCQQRDAGGGLDFNELSFLRWAMEETLRMYAPAWSLFARRNVRPVQMRGYEIEAGGWFYISPFITHRSESFFPEPLHFDPLRFSPQRRKEIPKHAYLPFGLGGHACLGSRMAIEQLVICAALILEQFIVRREKPNPDPRLVAKLALRPAENVVCRIFSRNCSESPLAAARGDHQAEITSDS